MRSLLLALLLLAPCAKADDGILIIGDSVSNGYTPYVQMSLPCVVHAPGNNYDTWYVLSHIDGWLAGKHYKIVHVNAGLWDIAHLVPGQGYTLDSTMTAPINTTTGEYSNNVGLIIGKIQATGATVIWATMTDVPVGAIGRLNSAAYYYDVIALDVTKAYGVYNDVDGLYGFMLPHADLHSSQDGHLSVHYTDAGYQLLASHVVDVLNAHGGCLTYRK